MRKGMGWIGILALCLLTGCADKRDVETVLQDPEEYSLSVESEVPSEDCFICGNREDSLMPYYGNRDSVGIIHWNDFSISDTEVRAYDDEGNELFGQEESDSRLNAFGEGYGSVSVHGMPNRGITDVTAYYEPDDEVDFDTVKEKLCQTCLDQVVDFYVDQKNYGEDSRLGTTGYCLVDFQTKKLFTLSDPYRGYFIKDYYVTYEIVEDTEGSESRIEMLIFYAPERVS